MKTSELALSLIKHFESLHDGDLSIVGLQPKMDPIGIWTVGYGHALHNPVTGDFLKGSKDKKIAYSLFPNLTEPQASSLLMSDLRQVYEPKTLQALPKGMALNDNQFGALVSFVYNCGTHYLNSKRERTPYGIWDMLRKKVYLINPVGFRMYWDSSVIKAGGVPLPGLIRRRKAEAHLFLTGTLKLEW